MSLSEKEKSEIIQKLESKGVNKECPRCGHNNFTLIDGYTVNAIQDKFQGFVLGGPSIPSVITACNNCGYISQHALGPLGLLPNKGKSNQGE